MTSKTCKNCNKLKYLQDFPKHQGMADGHINVCRECRKSYSKDYYSTNKKQLREKHREYYFSNLEKLTEYLKDYYRDNLNKIKKVQKDYYLKNKSDFIARAAGRSSLMKRATPPWSEADKIAVLYEKCKWLESLTGMKYHVDHVIPLQGDNVCGLHVWENLQILEASENIKKSNKFKIN